MREVRTLLLP